MLAGLLTAFCACAVLAADQGGITLNFKDADIREVAATIGQITHKNFIIDPRVQGRVTVVSSRPVSADAVYATFLSVLEVHGLAAAPAGDMIKIVPSLEARQMPGPPYNSSTPGDAVVTEVVQITNVSATQLVPVLRPLMSTEAQLAAYPQSNVLIVSDRASNVTRLLDIIQRIDQATDSEVEVIPLQNAPANDMVQVLNSLMQADASGQNGSPLKLVADERTNSILMSGDKGSRLRVRALIAHLDMPQESGNTQVVYLSYAKAKDISDELKGYVTDLQKQSAGKGAPAAGGGANSDVSVIPDERTNALIITAPPKMMRSIQDVIGKLDIRRAQVLVQAIEAELTSDKSAELGVTWVADAANNGGVGLTDFSNTGASILGVGQAALAASNSSSNGSSVTGFTAPQGLTLGVGKITSGGFSFAALIRALSGDGETNILSTPSVVTQDNQEATIKVTQKVPFVTGQYTGATTGASSSTGSAVINPFQTVDREDVGITLKITPQINEGDSVQMKIDQSVSNLTATSIGGQPVTDERQITTNILAKSGEIVVLGGLIDNALTESEQQVPVLGSIPLIGNLFKYRSTSNTKRNLMVFIQPTILRDSQTTQQYTKDRYNYFRNTQLQDRSPVQLMPGDQRPLLDELKAGDSQAPAGTVAVPTTAAPAHATANAPVAAPAAGTRVPPASIAAMKAAPAARTSAPPTAATQMAPAAVSSHGPEQHPPGG